MLDWTWQFNPTAVVALVGGAVTVVVFWVRSSDSAKLALAEAVVAKKRAEEAHHGLVVLTGSFAAYREIQAERVVSREVLKEVEERLANSIDHLAGRFDKLIQELIINRRESH